MYLGARIQQRSRLRVIHICHNLVNLQTNSQHITQPAHTTHSSANTLERNGFITFCFANNANFGGRNSLTKLKQQETREERKNVRFTA